MRKQFLVGDAQSRSRAGDDTNDAGRDDMDQETLFTASKWDILKLLAEQPLSPIELAQRSNTSVANISQQLRLLEMAGLVVSERVPNRDKGQPRILYSLAGNHSYLIATTNDFVEKKLFKLSTYNKIILRIWFHPRHELHYYLEKAFWQLEQHLAQIDAIALDERSDDPITLHIFTRDEHLKQKLHGFSLQGPEGRTREVALAFLHPDRPQRPLASVPLYTIFDRGTVIASLRSENNEVRSKKRE